VMLMFGVAAGFKGIISVARIAMRDNEAGEKQAGEGDEEDEP